jgi:hypothetical protein
MIGKRTYVRGPLDVRFWAHVIKSDGCWNWDNPNRHHGYGVINDGGGKILRANRVSWEIHFGPIADGFFVCHTCDNPACVRPDHLFLGTQTDNMEDCAKKGRVNREIKMRGESHYAAKLSWASVDEIRASRESSERLALKFEISIGTIYKIRRGALWDPKLRPTILREV